MSDLLTLYVEHPIVMGVVTMVTSFIAAFATCLIMENLYDRHRG
jgi:hypothetical protein